MNECCYSFFAQSGSVSIASGEREVFSASFDVIVEIKLWYNVREKPLILRAAAAENDKIVISVSAFRLSLYVNGNLADEEWPFGEPLFGSLEEAAGDFAIVSEQCTDVGKNQNDDVTRTFTGDDNTRIPGVNIGDCMPYSENDGTYHLFYLYDRHHHQSKWGLGAHQWSHVSTSDFITWKEHPMAVAISEPWEGSICTGSVMKAGDTYYAWYAVRMSDYSPARLTCSTSKDLYHFTKSGKYFTLPEAYEPTSARDPKVFEYDGVYHMFVTTTYVSTGTGCLAHLTSCNMNDWTDEGPVLIWKNGAQPECSDWFKLGKLYYLIYSIDGIAHYMYSESPFDGWISPEDNSIPCGTVPKCAFVNGKLIFSGFIVEGGYAGSLITAEAVQNSDGTLKFEKLKL